MNLQQQRTHSPYFCDSEQQKSPSISVNTYAQKGDEDAIHGNSQRRRPAGFVALDFRQRMVSRHGPSQRAGPAEGSGCCQAQEGQASESHSQTPGTPQAEKPITQATPDQEPCTQASQSSKPRSANTTTQLPARAQADPFQQFQSGRFARAAAGTHGGGPTCSSSEFTLLTRNRGVLARNTGVFKNQAHGDDRHSKNTFCVRSCEIRDNYGGAHKPCISSVALSLKFPLTERIRRLQSPRCRADLMCCRR